MERNSFKLPLHCEIGIRKQLASNFIRSATDLSHDAVHPSISPTSSEEAAWQLLRAFISAIDCNVFWKFQDVDGRVLTGIRPLNLNVTMNALLNGERVKLAYLTKKRFVQHCRGNDKYYYRSKWNAYASIGYGSHDNAWRKLNFDARCFALDERKFTSKDIALLLLGFDVDCHHGERDVQKTTDLILSLFPGSYHEASTNSLGCHLFVKLYYNSRTCMGSHYATLNYLQSLCKNIADGIECRRIHLGYDAALDGIRGLPTLIGFETQDGKPVIVKRTLDDGTVVERPRFKITCRNPVIKIPFYRNCSMLAVHQFFQAPTFNVQHLEEIQRELLVHGIGIPEYYFNDGFEEALSRLYAGDFDEPQKSLEDPDDKTSTLKTHNSVFPAALNYELAARNLVAVQNSHERRIEFGMLFARHLGRVPTDSELELEYQNLGLNKSGSQSDTTSFRFGQISRWLSQTFDPEKCRFGYGGYTTAREKTEDLMEQRVKGFTIKWSKGNGDRPITIAKLSALYWCMRHSQGRLSTTHFSRSQAKTALLETLKTKCHNAEIAAMFRVLQTVDLIEQVSGACPGQLGRGWAVKELS